MSTHSAAVSSQKRSHTPAYILGGLTFLFALIGLSMLVVGLLNLGSATSIALIVIGVIVFVGSTVWGVRAIKSATGVSIGQQFLVANAILVFAFFYIPILALIVFSFNAGNIPSVWEGFSFRWYASLSQDEAILRAFQNTLIVTFVSTIVSTIIDTMVALAMERYNFRLKLPFDAVLYMPIIIPDIVIALATLLFFIIIFNMVKNLLGITWGLGLGTIIIAHVAFNISFVATIVRARLIDMDPTLEQAARDLGANEWETFRRVTMPLLMPAIISGALLAFTDVANSLHFLPNGYSRAGKSITP